MRLRGILKTWIFPLWVMKASTISTLIYSNSCRFNFENYTLSFKINDHATVNSAFIRFPGLLYEMGLSALKSEVLAVKIEVDTNPPPPSAGLATTVVRRFVVLRLHHHDPATLLAGKLHAILQRPYTKGRDIYDLFWYLSDPSWPQPNFTFLNNALA